MNDMRRYLYAITLGTAVAAAQTFAGESRSEDRSAQPAQVAVESIINNPDAYFGQMVRVTAPVRQGLTRFTFTLYDASATGGLPLLVLLPEPGVRLRREARVTVTGLVKRFDRVEFERDYGWFDESLFGPPPELFQWQNRPVLVAKSVRTRMGTEIVGQSVEPDDGDRRDRQNVFVTTAGLIAEDPARLEWETVRVRTPVQEVIGPFAFTVDADVRPGADILVLIPGQIKRPAKAGHIVVVEGRLRTFSEPAMRAMFERNEFARQWWRHRATWAQWEGRPVILADLARSETGAQLAVEGAMERFSEKAPVRKVYAVRLRDLADDPDKYRDAALNVKAQVAGIESARLFTIRKRASGAVLKIANPHPLGSVRRGETVEVIGVLKVSHANSSGVQPFNDSTSLPDQLPSSDPAAAVEDQVKGIVVADSIRDSRGQEIVDQSPPRAED